MDGVDTQLARYPDSPVVLDVLGLCDADAIRAVAREAVPDAEEIFLFECSVGALFGVRRRDGSRVAVKVHKRVADERYLEDVQRVQAHLAAHGFPCPRPLGRRGLTTVEEWIDAGEYRDAHEPEVRRALAAALVRLHRLTESAPARPRSAFFPLDRRRLWPTPHNALFDFEATAAGAAWIDETAAAARELRDASPGREVVGHGDWSVKHFRFDGLRPTVVYDWDSLMTAAETHVVGVAAATFTYTEHLDVDVWPSVDESLAFVDDYESARGAAFTDDERRACGGAIVYATAYVARCSHAVGKDLSGHLKAFADAFL